MEWPADYKQGLEKYLYYEEQDGLLFCGDCLEVMQAMPDKNINLLVNDPPYNIGKAEWDKIDNYLEWSGFWIKEAERVLENNGSYYFFHNDWPLMSRLDKWIEENTLFIFKQFLVWNKPYNGVGNEGYLDGYVELNGLRNYQQMAEYILFYHQEILPLDCSKTGDHILTESGEQHRQQMEFAFTKEAEKL